MATAYPLSYTAPAATLSATTATAPTVLTFGTAGEDIMTAYKSTLAYVLMFVVLWGMSKTRIGYAAIYYSLVLIILLLLVTQYRFIAATLAPLSAPVGATSAPTGTITI